MKGSVVITIILSPSEKLTALAGASKLKECSWTPVSQSHSFTDWSAELVTNRVESPADHHRWGKQLGFRLKRQKCSKSSGTYGRHRSTRRLHCGPGKCRDARRCWRTTRWACDPWRTRRASRRLGCTWETWAASRAPSTISASSQQMSCKSFALNELETKSEVASDRTRLSSERSRSLELVRREREI